MRQFTAALFRFGLTLLASGTIPLNAATPDQTPSSAALMMNGYWAPDYNQCVEPTKVVATDKELHFIIHQIDHAETIVKTDGNTVYTKGADNGSDHTYRVEPNKISTLGFFSSTTIVRCWGASLATDQAAICTIAIQRYAAPEELVARIRSRFLELGLSPYITLDSLSVEDRGCMFHIKFLDDANKMLTLRGVECEPLYLGERRPLYRFAADKFLSLNYEVLNHRIPHDPGFENCFEEKNGMSIWDKVIVLISNEFAIPMNVINVTSKVGDCSTFIASYDHGSARFGDFGCVSAFSAKRPLLPAPKVASAAVSDSNSQIIDIDAVEKACSRVLSHLPGSTITQSDKDEDHITFIVRGLRNQVIVGSNYWEKITVNVFIWRNFVTLYGGGEEIEQGYHYPLEPTKAWGVKESVQFRVIADGSYSGGSGTYPKDEYFTQNMEPEYHEALGEFANKLSMAISESNR